MPLGTGTGLRPAQPAIAELEYRPQWRIEDDPLKTSEWEVQFIAASSERTRVEIEHRNLDRHGDGWKASVKAWPPTGAGHSTCGDMPICSPRSVEVRDQVDLRAWRFAISNGRRGPADCRGVAWNAYADLTYSSDSDTAKECSDAELHRRRHIAYHSLLFLSRDASRCGTRQFGVPLPAAIGNPDFERICRVHLNTLEWMPTFLVPLWLCALYLSDATAAGLGLAWIMGRILYFAGCSRAVEKRLPGFFIQSTACLLLFVGASVGIVISWAHG